jgi:ribosomal protein L24E
MSLGSSPAFGDSWTIVYGDPGPSNYSSAHAVAVAPDGAIYVLGTFFGVFRGHTAVDEFDLFAMKLDSAGAVEWVKAWDPASMDGTDYSADLDWKHNASAGEIFVDGAGNIGFALANFMAFIDSAGNEIAATDDSQNLIGGGMPIVEAKPQPDADGGAILGVGPEEVYGVVAVSSTLGVEWTHDEFLGNIGQIVPLPDGGAIRVHDRTPQFDFQPMAQTITRIGPDGQQMWSVLHNGRCSGTQFREDAAALVGATTVTIGAALESTNECTSRSPQFMASYSLETGELVQDLTFDNVEIQLGDPTIPYGLQSHACSPTAVGTAWDWQTGYIQTCPDPTDLHWNISAAYPRYSQQLASALYSIVPMRVIEPGGSNTTHLGLARFNMESGVIHLVSTTIVTETEGISVHDVAITADGSAVIVGRDEDGSPILPNRSGIQSLGATEASASVQAFVALSIPVDPPVDSFTDDDGSIFEADIEWLAAEGITKGCNPPPNDLFCPDAVVTRGQMAAFLVRALDLTDDGGGDLFVDDDGSIFEASIDKLASAGITKGCNPPDNTLFCPDDPVTRGQMAAFLVRALGYADDGGGNLFVDDDGSIFETAIDKLATAGVTRGCNPPVNDQFCPNTNVTRGQMAAFLHRALG